MEEKLRELNYQLDALTNSTAADTLFSEVVEDIRREIKEMVSALDSLEGAMIEKGFDQGVLDGAKRLGGNAAELARAIEVGMRGRTTEIMQRRSEVLEEILELEKQRR